MKATGAILTGWPLFYCDATSLPRNTNGSRPTSSRSFYVVRSHIVPDLGSLPRTRINLSTTGYTNKNTHATPMRIQTTRPIVISNIYW